MKTFMAIYVGTDDAQRRSGWDALSEQERNTRMKAGFDAWMAWGEKHKGAIVENGSPLGKTKRVGPDGVRDIRNAMTGYVIVQADSHEAAAKMFEGHPHFTLFPGDSVEVIGVLGVLAFGGFGGGCCLVAGVCGRHSPPPRFGATPNSGAHEH
jgi:hypothetical protein